jgi:hypothetical protein
MKPFLPTVLGLTLCEDVVSDSATQNISAIRMFTGMALDSFPVLAPPFCALASLTNGGGPTDIHLTVTEMSEDGQTTPYGTYRVNFTDRIQVVNFVVRLSRCVFHTPGDLCVRSLGGG